MKVVSFKFTKIYSEKFKEAQGSISVKSNFSLGSINKEELAGIKESIFSFEFTTGLDYDDIAKIEFQGKVYIALSDKKEIKDLENGKPSDEIKKLVLDYVLMKTHVDSLTLEEKMNLPFHIQAPRVTIEKAKK